MSSEVRVFLLSLENRTSNPYYMAEEVQRVFGFDFNLSSSIVNEFLGV